MSSKYIFRSQLGEFIETLKGGEFSLDDFELNEAFSSSGLRIELPVRVLHPATGFYFNVDAADTSRFFVEYLPGSDAEEELTFTDYWSDVRVYLDIWMTIIARELSAPDPWLLLNEGKVLADTYPYRDASNV